MPTNYTAEDARRMKEMWAAGNTKHHIAIELGKSLDGVKRFMKRHRENFPTTQSGSIRSVVLAALGQAPTVDAAARLLGWKSNTVFRWGQLLQKEGLYTGKLTFEEHKISRRQYVNDDGMQPIVKHLGARLWRYKQRDIRFNLTVDWVQQQFEKQKHRCYYTKCEFSMDSWSRRYITIDRLDSTKHYTAENCVLACSAANVAKHTMSEQQFVNLCKAVVAVHG